MDTPDRSFLEFSALCGRDPLRVQGPGGNTSVKLGADMWIKASGTELADAVNAPIFVAVNRERAKAEAFGAGDGTCQAAVLHPDAGLRPSIETTFHALLDWPFVFHTHSVATLAHAISNQGLDAARRKLADLPFAIVPYRKPGVPLTEAIADAIVPETQVMILANHGLIIAGQTVAEVQTLMNTVEACLRLDRQNSAVSSGQAVPASGYERAPYADALACDKRLFELATAGSYYPDHVVFLGPALPQAPTATSPTYLAEGVGAFIRYEATDAQRAMLACLTEVLDRVPAEWDVNALGSEAEAALLNWDAEKYRQALAARGAQNG